MPIKNFSSLIFFALTLALVACGEFGSELKVVGGKPVSAEDSSGQSVVALELADGSKTFCSGTLIHEQLVLTSAHCLAGKKPIETRVRMARGEIYRVVDWKSYKSEQKYGVNFDIAWIKLESQAKGYQSVELLMDPRFGKTAQDIRVMGYGQVSSLCAENDSNCRAGQLFEAPVKLSEYVNRGRWFHLLLTESKAGVGPCLGDSGGPLMVRVNDKSFVAGNFVGWDRRLVSEKRENICDNGQAIYNFAGAYRQWIEQSSGFTLAFDEAMNPKASEEEFSEPNRDPSQFQDWCRSRNDEDSAWYTVQRLISLAGDYAMEHGGDVRRVFEDCAYAENNLKNQIRLDQGLILDAFAPDSFGPSARISDLRPLEALKTFGVEVLVLSGHAIEDFTMIGSLPRLKRLEVIDNIAVVQGALDVSGPFQLERLLLKNAPRAVLLESISSITNLRYLNLENVRTEGSPVVIPGNKILELTVKADVDLELPELVPSLQKLELSGLRSIVMAKRLPKLRSFIMEESKQALRAGTSLAIDEMPMIESFIFRKNAGISAVILPEDLVRLRLIEIVASDLRILGDIRGMTKLVKLDMSRNQLSVLPQIVKVPALDSLNVSDNPLTELSSLNGLPKLRVLTAEGMNKGDLNKLGGLTSLPRLEELRLARNSFRSVKDFLRFPQLEVLVLSDNAIEDISNLSALKELLYLEVVNNPLVSKKCPLGDSRYCRFAWAN